MPNRNMLDDIKTYIVYYGHNSEEDLINYDLSIIEPKAHSTQGLQALKDAGNVLIAYISILEISSDDEFFNLLDEHDFMSKDGKRLINHEYKTYYMDITKEKVRNILIYRIESIMKKGYDGIFLDTIGSLEYFNLCRLYKEKLYDSVALLLSNVKKTFPKSIIIQNNGFIELCDYSGKYLDAICFENPPLHNFKTCLWTYSVIRKLNAIKNKHNLKVLLLDESLYNKNSLVFILTWVIKRIAKRNDWLYYKGKRYYNQI